MNNIDMTLRMMLNNVAQFNNVGPKPRTNPHISIFAPRNNFSLAMEVMTENRLSTKLDGSDMTSYTDPCVLSPLGNRYLEVLNKEFYRVYNFKK